MASRVKKGIIYTANTLLNVAKHAHDKLNEPPDIDQGLIAIVFAASAFEAFLNELDELAGGTGDSPGALEPIIALLSDVLDEAEACVFRWVTCLRGRGSLRDYAWRYRGEHDAPRFA